MRNESKSLFLQKKIGWIGIFALIGIFMTTALASGRFLNNNDGTVTDVKTGLMWAAKDNENPINWSDAHAYCQNYSGGGHTDWRLPTLTELASLYDPKYKNKRGYNVPKLIETSAQSIWASENRGFEAARFNFTYGQVFWLRQTYSGPTRALPVRIGK